MPLPSSSESSSSSSSCEELDEAGGGGGTREAELLAVADDGPETEVGATAEVEVDRPDSDESGFEEAAAGTELPDTVDSGLDDPDVPCGAELSDALPVEELRCEGVEPDEDGEEPTELADDEAGLLDPLPKLEAELPNNELNVADNEAEPEFGKLPDPTDRLPLPLMRELEPLDEPGALNELRLPRRAGNALAEAELGREPPDEDPESEPRDPSDAESELERDPDPEPMDEIEALPPLPPLFLPQQLFG